MAAISARNVAKGILVLGLGYFFLQVYVSSTVFSGGIDSYRRFLAENSDRFFVRYRRVTISGNITEKYSRGLDATFFANAATHYLVMGSVTFELPSTERNREFFSRVDVGSIATLSGSCDLETITNAVALDLPGELPRK